LALDAQAASAIVSHEMRMRVGALVRTSLDSRESVEVKLFLKGLDSFAGWEISGENGLEEIVALVDAKTLAIGLPAHDIAESLELHRLQHGKEAKRKWHLKGRRKRRQEIFIRRRFTTKKGDHDVQLAHIMLQYGAYRDGMFRCLIVDHDALGQVQQETSTGGLG
jgi:hypothetical protein